MTNEDISNTFDLLFNNLMSDRAPEINDYEKSLLLTIAQEELVKELYNNSFEGSEQARRALAPLVVDSDPMSAEKPSEKTSYFGPSVYKTLFVLPQGLWFVLNETVKVIDEGACAYGKDIEVKPERLDDLLYDLGNPFRGPSLARALRVDTDLASDPDENTRVEIYSKHKVDGYKVKYLRAPRPILLADFSADEAYYDIHIRGIKNYDSYKSVVGKGTELLSEPCELSETIQQEIINKAVILAKTAFA